jgi:hypothetical protein
MGMDVIVLYRNLLCKLRAVRGTVAPAMLREATCLFCACGAPTSKRLLSPIANCSNENEHVKE